MKNSLKKFKNLHKNKKVFLVGNGPSLNRTPLDEIKDDFSIAMNRVSLIYKKTKWRPTYFVCSTINIYDEAWKKDIMETINMGVTSFVWDKFKPLLGERDNIYYINCTNGKEVTNTPKNSWWSNDINSGVSKFGTSMLVVMQIANYMGFNPIYLLGCDLGFVDAKRTLLQKKILKHVPGLIKDKNHFSSSYNTPGLSADKLNSNMLAAHKLAYKNFQKNGKSVYNSTIGGQLELYQRKNLEKVILK